VLAVEAASSRLKRQDGASTTQRTVSALAETMIDAEREYHAYQARQNYLRQQRGI
jgi:hypothetical protein